MLASLTITIIYMLFTRPKENVLIDDDGQPKLAGFTSVKMESSGRASRSSQEGSGIIQWMSPELLNPDAFGLGNRDPTTKSDCFALGMVIYEVLTGRVPFARYNGYMIFMLVLRGDRPERPEGYEGRWLTDEIWGALEICWRERPDDRPTAEGILACLEASPRPQLPPEMDTEDQLYSQISELSTSSSHYSRLSLIILGIL